jgi:DNA-binding CsgD family transcriptional regulator
MTDLTRLKPRELELMRLLVEGWGLKEAAHQLQLTSSNASVILARARDRAGAVNSEQFVAMLFRAGLLK